MNSDKLETRDKRKQAGTIKLSARLLTVAGFVRQGSRIADVGTDHGYIPVYLAQTGRIASALAMDVRSGPLERAQAGRMLLVNSAQVPAKQTKNTAGVNVVTLKKNQSIIHVRRAANLELTDPHRYRVRTLPAAGAILRGEDTAEQMQLL